MKANYYEHKSAGYGIGRTRLRRMLELVGNAKAQHILDIGCANGKLGGLLKEQGNIVVGIEISPDAAENARKVLDRVYSFDIESAWPDDIRQERFDCVIMSELLEHVFDPVAVLRQVRMVLKEGGSIVITTPNFMTWTNRLRFLIGDFAYQEQGMFDFGHIRWFTYRYLKEVLAEAGFRIQEERHIIFPGKLTAILKYFPSLFAWQFVLKARLSAPVLSSQEKTAIQGHVSKFKSFISARSGELLYNLAAGCTGRGVIVEIGSFCGTSTVWLAKGSLHGKHVPVYAIDPHIGSVEHQRRWGNVDTYPNFLSNIEGAGVRDIVTPIRKKSDEVALSFDKPIELIFIDGDHSYEAVKNDFCMWFPKVVDGGVMVFDDTIGWPGPRKVVREFLYLSKKFKDVRFIGPLTYARKVHENTILDRVKSLYNLCLKDIAWFFLDFLQDSSGIRFPTFIKKIGKKLLFSPPK